MLFFGIDPSYSETGLSVIDEDGFHETTSYKTVHKKKVDKKEIVIPSEDRILKIWARIMEFILENNGSDNDIVWIEGLAISRVGVSTHMLAGLHYYIRTRLFECPFKFEIVPPSTLKKFVLGKHNKKGIGKQHMLLHIYKRWGHEFKNDNLADAYALAQFGRYKNGFGDEK